MGKGITMHKQDPTTVLPKGILPSETQLKIFQLLKVVPKACNYPEYQLDVWNAQLLAEASKHMDENGLAVLFTALGGTEANTVWLWELPNLGSDVRDALGFPAIK
jgi:hypothetical protein